MWHAEKAGDDCTDRANVTRRHVNRQTQLAVDERLVYVGR